MTTTKMTGGVGLVVCKRRGGALHTKNRFRFCEHVVQRGNSNFAGGNSNYLARAQKIGQRGVKKKPGGTQKAKGNSKQGDLGELKFPLIFFRSLLFCLTAPVPGFLARALLHPPAADSVHVDNDGDGFVLGGSHEGVSQDGE